MRGTWTVALGLALVAGGCSRRMTCEDALFDGAAGAADPAWSSRGVTVPPGALVCGSNASALHVLEETDKAPDRRAAELRDGLTKKGWIAGSEGYEGEGDYMVRVERGDERLFFNVHKAEKRGVSLGTRPTLGWHMAFGVKKPTP